MDCGKKIGCLQILCVSVACRTLILGFAPDHLLFFPSFFLLFSFFFFSSFFPSFFFFFFLFLLPCPAPKKSRFSVWCFDAGPKSGKRVPGFSKVFCIFRVFFWFFGGAPFFPKKTKFSFRVFWVGPELLVSLLLEPKRFLLALWFHTRTASVPRVNLPIVRTPPEKQKLWKPKFLGFPPNKTKKKHPNLRNLFLLWDFLFGGVSTLNPFRPAKNTVFSLFSICENLE